MKSNVSKRIKEPTPRLIISDKTSRLRAIAELTVGGSFDLGRPRRIQARRSSRIRESRERRTYVVDHARAREAAIAKRPIIGGRPAQARGALYNHVTARRRATLIRSTGSLARGAPASLPTLSRALRNRRERASEQNGAGDTERPGEKQVPPSSIADRAATLPSPPSPLPPPPRLD